MRCKETSNVSRSCEHPKINLPVLYLQKLIGRIVIRFITLVINLIAKALKSLSQSIFKHDLKDSCNNQKTVCFNLPCDRHLYILGTVIAIVIKIVVAIACATEINGRL